MARRNILFNQTGGAPDKNECKVRWSVDTDLKIIKTYFKSDGSWKLMGTINPSSIELISKSHEDEWIILRYENKSKMQLVVDGPVSFDADWYWLLKIEEVVGNSHTVTKDDSLLSEKPRVEYGELD